MELSLSQSIGLVSVGAVVAVALGFMGYAAKRISYIFRGSLRTAVIWGAVALILQTILLLAYSFDA